MPSVDSGVKGQPTNNVKLTPLGVRAAAVEIPYSLANNSSKSSGRLCTRELVTTTGCDFLRAPQRASRNYEEGGAAPCNERTAADDLPVAQTAKKSGESRS